MVWSQSAEEVAELLRVDVPTLTKRLEHLHMAERGYLKRRLSEVEG